MTQWQSDGFSQGAIPHVRPCRSGADWAALAEPVRCPTTQRPYLFFAGDHTDREYGGTLHGAFLSGLRAARQLADSVMLPVNDPTVEAELAELGRKYMDSASSVSRRKSSS